MVKKNKVEDHIDFEINFYEKILKDKPDFIQALIAIGDLYTRKGWHEKGLEVDKKLSRMRPEDPYILYNLSCSYSLLNQVDKAHSSMKLAIQNGYQDFKHMLRDQDLTNLLKSEPFREYLTSIKDKNSPQSENKPNLKP